jgi:phosphoglycolate phosphatase-like HAD superfamily hydrolase
MAYLDLLARLGDREPRRAAYVGDGEHNELLGAKEAGIAITVLMRGYVAGTGFRSSADLESLSEIADVVIDCMPELLPHIVSSKG